LSSSLVPSLMAIISDFSFGKTPVNCRYAGKVTNTEIYKLRIVM